MGEIVYVLIDGDDIIGVYPDEAKAEERKAARVAELTSSLRHPRALRLQIKITKLYR